MDPRPSRISWVHHDEIEASWKSLRSHAAMLLTCYHLTFATVTTQILARFSTVLDGRHLVRMTPKLYVRAIVPIGVFYSLSLVCSNLPYLYLSVAFIQMLKVPQTPDPDTSQLGRADNRIQGYSASLRISCPLLSRPLESDRWHIRQLARHCSWGHVSVVGRDQVSDHWIPVPGRRPCFRGLPSCLDPEAPER